MNNRFECMYTHAHTQTHTCTYTARKETPQSSCPWIDSDLMDSIPVLYNKYNFGQIVVLLWCRIRGILNSKGRKSRPHLFCNISLLGNFSCFSFTVVYVSVSCWCSWNCWVIELVPGELDHSGDTMAISGGLSGSLIWVQHKFLWIRWWHWAGMDSAQKGSSPRQDSFMLIQSVLPQFFTTKKANPYLLQNAAFCCVWKHSVPVLPHDALLRMCPSAEGAALALAVPSCWNPASPSFHFVQFLAQAELRLKLLHSFPHLLWKGPRRGWGDEFGLGRGGMLKASAPLYLISFHLNDRGSIQLREQCK